MGTQNDAVAIVLSKLLRVHTKRGITDRITEQNTNSPFFECSYLREDFLSVNICPTNVCYYPIISIFIQIER